MGGGGGRRRRHAPGGSTRPPPPARGRRAGAGGCAAMPCRRLLYQQPFCGAALCRLSFFSAPRACLASQRWLRRSVLPRVLLRVGTRPTRLDGELHWFDLVGAVRGGHPQLPVRWWCARTLESFGKRMQYARRPIICFVKAHLTRCGLCSS